jgi:hypothetical protein
MSRAAEWEVAGARTDGAFWQAEPIARAGVSR